jgi:hypothetical protein
MQIERPTNTTPSRQVAATRGRLVAAILLGVVLVNPARAGAAALECQTFSPEPGTTGIGTWGGFDAWILESDGEQLRFDAPGDGVWLDAGGEVDLVHKCRVSEDPTPEAPTPEPTEDPIPEAIEDPTPEPAPEPTEDPAPEPTEEPTPDPIEDQTPDTVEDSTPEPAEEPTPEPTVAPTPEPTPEPIILRSPPAPRTPPADPQAPAGNASPGPSAPAQVGDAEVLGLQLARTGADRAVTLATVGGALLLGGLGCLGVSGRLARRS